MPEGRWRPRGRLAPGTPALSAPRLPPAAEAGSERRPSLFPPVTHAETHRAPGAPPHPARQNRPDILFGVAEVERPLEVQPTLRISHFQLQPRVTALRVATPETPR